MSAAMRAGGLVLVLVGITTVAQAYDVEIEARSTGQGYQVRWLRFRDADRFLNRRRFTQELRLHLWNLLAPTPSGDPDELPRRAPADLYFTSSLRFDHDFGGFTHDPSSFLVSETMSTSEDAVTSVPELANQDLALDILYAYVGGRKVFGLVDFQLGRQLQIDTFDWVAFDGLQATVRLPWYVDLEVHGGLVVRESSFFGGSTFEPDGTSGAQCRTFSVDGPDGEQGFIRAEGCAQRDALMPTWGVALETRGLQWLAARVSYRRSQSVSADVTPDTRDETPAWGVNEEKLSLGVRGNFRSGGIVPWVGARYNVLLGIVDEAHAGLRLAWRDVAVTPEVLSSWPTFDGDSIFNVFSTEPYEDARLTVELWPHRRGLRLYARAFLRWFHTEDGLDTTLPDQAIDKTTTAAGGRAGARLAGGRGVVRLDLGYEDGYGGLRATGDLSGRMQIWKDLELEGRLTVVRFEDDLRADRAGTSVGGQAGGRWLLGEGMALHLLTEVNSNRFTPAELRVIGVLDLAFRPDL
jgi:hypothetical protein